MEENFMNCSDDTVVSWEDTTFKASILNKKIREALLEEKALDEAYEALRYNIGYSIGYDSYKQILSDGIDCEILEPGAKGWQKGKMRLRVNVEVAFIREEAEPETTEPESPLDDLRQKLRDET